MAYLTQRPNIPVVNDGSVTPVPIPTNSQWFAPGSGDIFSAPTTGPDFYGTNTSGNFPSSALQGIGVGVTIANLTGPYTSEQLNQGVSNNPGGNQDTGLPFGNYTIGAVGGVSQQATRAALYSDAGNSYPTDPNVYSPGLDLSLQDIGRQLDYFASSPGSPADNARLAGIKATNEFYRNWQNDLGTYYGVPVQGPAISQRTSPFVDTNGSFVGGAVPADWNKDNNGNPLPYGARREADGNVYYSTSGGVPINPAQVSYVPTGSTDPNQVGLIAKLDNNPKYNFDYSGKAKSNTTVSSPVYTFDSGVSNVSKIYSSSSSYVTPKTYSSGVSGSNTSKWYSF